jgi:hypothetical protein
MSGFVEQHPILVAFTMVLVMLIYARAGGINSFCKWRGIDLRSRRTQYWVVSIILVLTISLIIATLVFSGLFAFSYLIVKLLMLALAKLGKDTQRTRL